MLGGHPSELHTKASSGGWQPSGGPPASGPQSERGPPAHRHRFEAPTASTSEEAKKFIDDRVADGADYIKIMIEEGSVLQSPGLPPSEQRNTYDRCQ